MSDAVAKLPVVRPEADAGAVRVAQVYAQALLDDAEKHHCTAEIEQELDMLVRNVAGKDPLLASFFLGGVLGRDRRRAVLHNAFDGRVSELFLNFLLVLNDHDRLELLRLILEQYRQLREQREGKVHVYAVSAVPLTGEQQERLVQHVRELTGQEPVLETVIDPEILGGLIVQVGDFRFDASVRSQLAKLRNQLIERSSHEIQAGRDRFSSAN